MSDIEKIYYHFEHLCDSFVDLEDTKNASEELNGFLRSQTGKLFTDDMMLKVDDYTSRLCAKNEKQGFIYGFQYAMALATSGQRKSV